MIRLISFEITSLFNEKNSIIASLTIWVLLGLWLGCDSFNLSNYFPFSDISKSNFNLNRSSIN